YSVSEAARSLGVHQTVLRSWKLALETKGADAFPGQGKLPAIEEELRRLRAENKRLQAERDILKKVTAFFAREATGPSASSKNTAVAGRSACCARRSASRRPASTPGGSGRRVSGSNAATRWPSRSGPSMPRSRPATAVRASTPS